ncbi:MAG: YdcF family protein [Gracilibacteraceae bacterium]|jgi:uncharacterized SAM-binding protein YcdF (DUF218 family)|nr:YdcF family protein [Gracilibacteraceae bacterium]
MNNSLTVLVIAAAVFALVFALIFRRDKTSFAAGAFFDLALLSALLAWLLFAAAAADHWLTRLSAGLIMITAVLIILFGAYLLAVFFLLNARIVLRREKRSLANSLSLLAAFGVMALTVAAAFMRGARPEWLQTVWNELICLSIFYFLHILAFLTTLTLFNLARPDKNWDYILVLGSGLIEGRVPPLLANRVLRALACAERQKNRGSALPVLVMCGGRGADEPRSEAEAMREFAVARGYPGELVLMEGQSVNTEENMLFARMIIEKRAAGKPYNCAFVTSNFHLLRAARFARQAGLPPEGIGSKTAWYYMPNAVMREYVAFLSMSKIKYIAAAAAVIILAFLFPDATLYLTRLFPL